MNTHHTINRMSDLSGTILSASPARSLLDGPGPVANQTRVMVANQMSRFVHPADLDAFLQGYAQGF